jgi:hypothetical protein
MGAAAAVAGIGAVAGLAGGMMQSGAISGAQDSANAASAAAREQARADLQPWVTTGGNALGITGDLSGANGPDAATAAMANFQTSPGYQWQLGEGLRAVDAGAAAKGMLRSGATLKGEMEYGQGLASQDFSSYYNRLSDLSKLGQTSAAGQGAASMSAGKDIAQTDASAGAAQASIYGDMASGLSTAANKYATNSLYAGGGSGGGLVYGAGGDSLNYAANRAYR